jgi:arabinan endo-1,5-alpha-L-arabinosidase
MTTSFSRFARLGVGLLLAAAGPFAVARQVSIHDPVMAREGDTYYLFSTGPGITFYRSKNMTAWELAGRVFPTEPVWARDVAPKFNGHLWAPDIQQHDGKFLLYYSVSAFARNTSAIGLTINATLDPASPDYKWEDQGVILQSVPNRDLWNAIDSHVIVDGDGTPWMSFGSFWGGLKLVKLAPDWKSIAEPQEWHSIAKRERSVLLDDRRPGPAEIEAPFIFHRGGHYYLFVSWDKCCRGVESTYKMVVGRAKDVRGPYLDKEGRDLAEGGGTLLLAGNPAWPGLGHNSVYNFDGKDYLVFHAYEAADGGLQKLKIASLTWDADEWPIADAGALLDYTSTLVGPEPEGMRPPPGT